MLLIVAILSMICALSFYTSGVFGEKRTGKLVKKHVIIFWSGLFFDTLGTSLMALMSEGFSFNIHGITGLIALILMTGHVFWATWVLVKGNEQIRKSFHKYSFLVWLIWLIPFISGMLLNALK
jgi:uncharacterized repeat protein (TIGR03987 family)